MDYVKLAAVKRFSSTNHSTSQFSAKFRLIFPNQTAAFSEFEIAGGSWHLQIIIRKKIDSLKKLGHHNFMIRKLLKSLIIFPINYFFLPEIFLRFCGFRSDIG